MRLGNAIGWALTLMVFVPNTGAGRFHTYAAIAASGFLLVGLVRNRVTFVPAAVLLIVAFYASVGVSTLGQGRIDEVAGLLQAAIPVTLFAWVASAASGTDRSVIARWVVVLAMAQSVIAVAQFHLGVLPFWGWLNRPEAGATYSGLNPLTGELGRAPGSMAHGIPLAMLLGVSILILLSGRVVRSWAWRLILAGLAAYAIILTGSRSAVIVLVAACLFLLATAVRNALGRTLLVIGLIAVVLAVNIPGLQIFTSLDGSVSLLNRVGAWDTLVSFLELGPWNALFGNGWGTSLSAETGAWSTSLAIDNAFVSTVALGGLLSLAALLAFVIRGLATGDALSRAVILMSVGMFLSFDVIVWTANFAILVVFVYMNEPTRVPSSPSARSNNRSASRVMV